MSTTSLDLVKEGRRAVIRGFNGECGWTRRLQCMGITPGTEVEVLLNRKRGPLVLRVKNGTEISIGRGLARKIAVEVLE
ncbi:MAG: ferrous iron transport protein A [Desulfurococcaceae archaeon]